MPRKISITSAWKSCQKTRKVVAHMSGSLSLIIVLIVVVWAIVLAPMVLGDSKPIRRSGEGYDETRVLHQGNLSLIHISEPTRRS